MVSTRCPGFLYHVIESESSSKLHGQSSCMQWSLRVSVERNTYSLPTSHSLFKESRLSSRRRRHTVALETSPIDALRIEKIAKMKRRLQVRTGIPFISRLGRRYARLFHTLGAAWTRLAYLYHITGCLED